MLDQLLAAEGTEAISHLMPQEARLEISSSPALRPYKDELIRGSHARQALRLLEQRKLKLVADRLETAHIQGIGRKIATIHPEIYAQLEAQYGQGCLYDREFLHDTLKRNPELRVQCAPRALTLRVNGLRDQGRAGTAEPTDCHRPAAGAPLVSVSEARDIPAAKTPRRGPCEEPAPWEQVDNSGRLEAGEKLGPPEYYEEAAETARRFL